MEKAGTAKTMQITAEEKEKLILIKAIVSAENQGAVSVDKYVDKLVSEGLTTNDKVTDNGDGSKTAELESGTKVTITQDGKSDVKLETEDGVIGGGGSGGTNTTAKPTIKGITVLETTSTSIKVQVDVQNLNGGTFEYYYKPSSEADDETDSKYIKAEGVSGNPATITGLTDKTSYDIKVVVKNANGETKEYKKGVIAQQVIKVSGITSDATSKEIKAGFAEKITVTVQPENATNPTLEWKSSDNNVAKVENGVITGISAGTATIEAKTTDGSNKTVSCEVTVVAGQITATDIANSNAKSGIYGKYVTNYSCTNSSDELKWRVLYAGNAFDTSSISHIYLIADNCINPNLLPSKSGAKPTVTTNGSSPYECVFNNSLLEKYSGVSSLATLGKKLNNQFFNVDKLSGTTGWTGYKWDAIAYMLETSLWTGFKASNADYAIGSPTMDILVKSYNEYYGTSHTLKAMGTSPYEGYKVSFDGASYNNFVNGFFYETENFYTVNNDKAYNYYIASPCNNSDWDVWSCSGSGRVLYRGVSVNDYGAGFRPVVCLNSSAKLEANGDGTFSIK